MGCSTLHIKTEIECRVFLFDEEKGIATPGSYFNLEVRKGEQDLLFVSTNDESLRCQMFYNVEENDCDYRVELEKTRFKKLPQDFLKMMDDAEQGNANAQYYLGKCYLYGLGVDSNKDEAMRWFLKAAKQGEGRAQDQLCCYYIGSGSKQNYTEAANWSRKAAEQGFVRAQFVLGWCYYNGKGVTKNYTEAVKWYRKAAEQGNSNAQNILGDCYYDGEGVEKNYTEAANWYRKAAEQGNASAQSNLGMCYRYGNGVEQDYVEAIKWFNKAAKQENTDAQYNLGKCYLYGKGTEKNYTEAVKLIRKAAEKGFAKAQRQLGEFYQLGLCGVEKDYSEAVKWYSKAAEQGNDRAKFDLGSCYESMQNYSEAIYWYRKAQEEGYDVKEYLENIENELNKQNKSPYYLFFDTETTGVPKNYKAPASDTDNWPRLVQLGWILTDKDGNTLNEGNEIVRPEGFIIPADAANVHGITTEKARQLGKPLQDVIELFLNDVKQVKYLVGHNISFDQRVVGAELCRLGLTDIVSNKKSICTMKTTVDFCKIPGRFGCKYPQLQELYTKLFGCKFEDAHDAMADITATKKCFFELKRMGVL